MSFIYIIGVAGSGKSAICDELHRRGLDVYDEDGPGVGAAHNKQTGEIVQIPHAEQRTPEWFQQHEFKVTDKVLDELKIKSKNHTVILCGNSINDEEIQRLFDKVIYLHIDEATLRQRIESRADNDYGKTDHELQSILARYKTMEQKYNAANSLVIDATEPLNEVVDKIVASL